MAVERGHDEQQGEEHGDQADDDRGAVRVDDEDDATTRAEGPDSPNDAAGSLHRHDVVIPQCIKDGDVPGGENTLVSVCRSSL